MNQYEQFISDYLNEYKEVSLDKIGTVKLTAGYVDEQNHSMNADFIFDRKAVTSPELTNYIAQKTSKNKMLIASDLESHFTQAREFINTGKTYEIGNAGFIKKNNSGIYELLPASQAVKAQKNFSKPVQQRRQQKKTASSAVQIFTLLIVLAILCGLGWEAYQFFVKKPPVDSVAENEQAVGDSTANSIDSTNKKDTATIIAIKPADTTKPIVQSTVYKNNDTVNIKYIFERTNLLLRAQTRTVKLIGYGNDARYDSIANNPGKLYSLYILKRTRISDTAKIKDSIAKFLQKPVEIKIASNK